MKRRATPEMVKIIRLPGQNRIIKGEVSEYVEECWSNEAT